MSGFQPVRTPAFNIAVAFLIDRIEDPDGRGKVITDSGGLTRWGISQRAYPALGIATLSRLEAEELYFRDYWLRVRGDDLPPGLGLIIFVMAVVGGVGPAVRTLQRCLGVRDDGEIGPDTLRAARAMQPPSELRAAVTEMQLRYFDLVVKADPDKVQYLHGWRMRALRVADEAGRMSAVT